MTKHHHILTFHGLGTPPSRLDLEQQSVWLDAGHFESILDAIEGRSDVLVTFDDGNLSDCEIALPALVARGRVASFFVCSGRIGSPGYLGREQIVALRDAGMTVGSHGDGHIPWRGLDEASLTRELTGSRAALEAILGESVALASCPFGFYDARVLRALNRSGYSRVYTSDGGPTDREQWLQSRNTVHVSDSVAYVLGKLQASPRSARERLRCLKIAIKQRR